MTRAEALLQAADAAMRLDRVRAARELYEQAAAVAVDVDARAAALSGLGCATHRAGRPAEAIDILERALTVRGEPPSAWPEVAEALGRAYAEIGNLGRAAAIFDECRRRFRREGDRVGETRFACLVGYALTDCGRFEEAERALEEALEAGANETLAMTRARLCWAQARLRGEQGRTELAAEHARAALEILATTDEIHMLALTYELLASLYNDLGRCEEALSLLREGWPMLMNNASPLEVMHYRLEEARALAALGQKEGAAALAMRTAAQLGDTLPGDAGRAHLLLGQIFDDLADTSRAHEHYATAIALLERQGPSRYLAQAYRRLGELFEREYRTKDAIAVTKRALAIQQRVEAVGSAPAAA